MKLQLLLVVAVGLIVAVSANDDPTVSLPGVQDLTPETFDSFVNGKKHAIVEFYAPWCGHCKRLTPEYLKLGAAVAADPKLASAVVIAKVDADKHRTLGERFGVQGFPTIKYFKRGKPVSSPEDYNGGRTSDDFLEFLRSSIAADKDFARVSALDGVAQKFLGEGADLAAIVAEAETAAKELTGEAVANGALYLKFMKKAVEKGVEYLAKESARLERVLESGSVSGGKAAEISQKLSVLTAFLPEAPEASVPETEE